MPVSGNQRIGIYFDHKNNGWKNEQKGQKKSPCDGAFSDLKEVYEKMLRGNFSFSYGLGFFCFYRFGHCWFNPVQHFFSLFRNFKVREIAFVKLFDNFNRDIIPAEIYLPAE